MTQFLKRVGPLVLVVSLLGFTAVRQGSSGPAGQPALHSLEPLPARPVKDDPKCKTFARQDAQAADPVLRVLGDPPLEPMGEMMKPVVGARGPIETVSILNNGDVLFGENAGIQRQETGTERGLRSDPSHCSPIDFWWDAQNRKLHLRSLEVTENGDAPEIGLRRSGDGTYPNGPPLPSRQGDNLGILFWMGWAEGAGFDDRAGQIYVRAAEDITAQTSGGNMYLATTPKGSTAAPVDRLILSSEGQVGVNVDPPQAQLHVMGPAPVGVAEDYRSAQSLEPGDVVIVAQPSDVLSVQKASRPYDQKLVGVVSGDAAVRISQDRGGPRKHHGVDPHDYPIAAAGRVFVKVSIENGPIEPGDYLTSSSTAGVAMKATKKGPVVAKALERFRQTPPGKIAALMSVTFFNP